jgi:hypothetical protein
MSQNKYIEVFIPGNGLQQLELSYLDKRSHETYSNQGLLSAVSISDVYTEVMKRMPMGQPLHLSPKLLLLSVLFKLSNHSLHVSAGSDNLH